MDHLKSDVKKSEETAHGGAQKLTNEIERLQNDLRASKAKECSLESQLKSKEKEIEQLTAEAAEEKVSLDSVHLVIWREKKNYKNRQIIIYIYIYID